MQNKPAQKLALPFKRRLNRVKQVCTTYKFCNKYTTTVIVTVTIVTVTATFVTTVIVNLH